jgi:hypothetical protein
VPEEGKEKEGGIKVEVHGVAYVLTRESEFFMGALSNGFKETTTKVINYHAYSEQGERQCRRSPSFQTPALDGIDFMLWIAECEDLKLLIRLMHSMRGYTSDEGRTL